MKNIHLLPTDKPSRLAFIHDKLYFDKEEEHITSSSQNIYITNDEEIKKGEYRLHIPSETISKWTGDGSLRTKEYKKIVLTDNPDLIKDGVQKIDDEFLEWFVKNSSCESIEVKIVESDECNCYYSKLCKSTDLDYKTHCSDGGNIKSYYKIIIPKEEPKQETLEEARRKYVSDINCELYSEQIVDTIKAFSSDAFEQGYKFAQEQIGRLYNEEDMIKASEYGYNFHKTTQFPEQEFKDSCVRNTKQWLTTFKKQQRLY